MISIKIPFPQYIDGKWVLMGTAEPTRSPLVVEFGKGAEFEYSVGNPTLVRLRAEVAE